MLCMYTCYKVSSMLVLFTTLEAFKKAIAELKAILGYEYVELNDKPLVDGWCVSPLLLLLSFLH